jgi:hypothetical protein|tara:strand:+ start:965 stop:1351 length:387 start_codon:yes stop_codon:yes gene_type:complete
MNWKVTYTKIFLKQLNIAISEATLKEYIPVWWQNNRSKETGGLRLTDEGIRVLTDDVQLSTYDVPFPKDFELTTNTIIWLDQFIDCPWWLGRHGIVVTDERKAVELSLFSGDVRKYGITKALNRQNKG